MFKMNTLLIGITSALVVAMGVVAQMPPGPGGDGGGFPPGVGFPGLGQGDGLADIQTLIRASNEEWKVIGPKIRTVMAARTAIEASIDVSNISNNANQSGRFGPGGGPFGGGPPGNDSFEGPGMGGPGGFRRGGPGRGGFGPGGPDPNRMGPGPGGAGPGQGGFGPGPQGFGRGGRGPGGGPPGFGGPGNAVTQALMELRTVAVDPNATTEQIKEKAAAVRTARQKTKADLAAAQKNLVQLLTQDQEAMLVVLGYLD